MFCTAVQHTFSSLTYTYSIFFFQNILKEASLALFFSFFSLSYFLGLILSDILTLHFLFSQHTDQSTTPRFAPASSTCLSFYGLFAWACSSSHAYCNVKTSVSEGRKQILLCFSSSILCRWAHLNCVHCILLCCNFILLCLFDCLYFKKILVSILVVVQNFVFLKIALCFYFV